MLGQLMSALTFPVLYDILSPVSLSHYSDACLSLSRPSAPVLMDEHVSARDHPSVRAHLSVPAHVSVPGACHARSDCEALHIASVYSAALSLSLSLSVLVARITISACICSRASTVCTHLCTHGATCYVHVLSDAHRSHIVFAD